MRRRDFVVLLGSSAVCPLTPPRAFSQQLASIPRVGVLVSASEPHPFADALRRGLEQLGYSDGRNIALDVRYTQGRSDRAAELAADLVRNGVTIIVAHFTPAVRAAMAATKTIPIVMAPAGASTAKLKTTPVLVSGRSCRSYHAEHNPSHFDVPFWG